MRRKRVESEAVVLEGNCLKVLREIPKHTFTACVTDPPYGLAFSIDGEKWDAAVPTAKYWKRVRRVLKPGAPLLAFCGTRTYFHLAMEIEKAGFEIRDCLMWLTGEGFPKGLDISKALDKEAGAEREIVGKKKAGLSVGSGKKRHFVSANKDNPPGVVDITVPKTKEAQAWDGWNTNLRPNWEPIILAMKPLDGSYANNALKYGVAGLNVKGTRVGPEGLWPPNVACDETVMKMFEGKPRFMFCPKADVNNRSDFNSHTTVKPVELMRWLCRLVSYPEQNHILDPFCGSGSTGVAAKLEGLNFTGIEMSPEYVKIARRRIKQLTHLPWADKKLERIDGEGSLAKFLEQQ